MIEPIIRDFSYLISCLIGMIIIFYFMNDMYQPKYSKKINIILYFTLSFVWFFFNLFENPMLNFTSFVIISFVVGFVLYRIQFKEILQIIIFILTYAGCDIIVSALFSVFQGSLPMYTNNPILFLLNVIIAQTMMIVIYKFLIFYFKKQKNFYMSKKQYIFLAVFPILNIVVMYVIILLGTYEVDQSTKHIVMVLMTITSAILNMAVIYLIENISKSKQLENDIRLIEQRMDMRYSYYQQLEMEYDKSQDLMHDIKNHIKVFERLYQADQNSEGLEYTKKIYDLVDELGMKFNNDNKILNIIVNENIRICEIHHIEFIYSVENLDLSFIDEIDITAIFSNLLDNAVEACEKIGSGTKRIELRVYQFNNMIIINIINSVGNIPIQKDGKFVSAKKSHKAIGLSNVMTSVYKYNGDISFDVEQDKFSVSIIFPVG